MWVSYIKIPLKILNIKSFFINHMIVENTCYFGLVKKMFFPIVFFFSVYDTGDVNLQGSYLKCTTYKGH